MSVIGGLRRMKAWGWILLLIFLAIVFLFRFEYQVIGKANGSISFVVRINRITGRAKFGRIDGRSGKFISFGKPQKKLLTEEEYLQRYFQ